MALKGVHWVYMANISDKLHVKSGNMVVKGVNWVNNTKIRLYGLERSQLVTQYKNKVKWS